MALPGCRFHSFIFYPECMMKPNPTLSRANSTEFYKKKASYRVQGGSSQLSPCPRQKMRRASDRYGGEMAKGDEKRPLTVIPNKKDDVEMACGSPAGRGIVSSSCVGETEVPRGGSICSSPEGPMAIVFLLTLGGAQWRSLSWRSLSFVNALKETSRASFRLNVPAIWIPAALYIGEEEANRCQGVSISAPGERSRKGATALTVAAVPFLGEAMLVDSVRR